MVDGLMLEALNIASLRVDGWLMVQSFRVKDLVYLLVVLAVEPQVPDRRNHQ